MLVGLKDIPESTAGHQILNVTGPVDWFKNMVYEAWAIPTKVQGLCAVMYDRRVAEGRRMYRSDGTPLTFL